MVLDVVVLYMVYGLGFRVWVWCVRFRVYGFKPNPLNPKSKTLNPKLSCVAFVRVHLRFGFANLPRLGSRSSKCRV